MSGLQEKMLSRITADFQVLAKVVLRQQENIKQLLENNKDDALYTEINNDEHIIDSLEVKIRNEVINTIVLYSPRATNLRMIISYYDMTAYLERIGDLILNIAKYLLKVDLQGEVFEIYKPKFLKMLALTGNMTQNAIFAFTCADIQLARETIEMDHQVDQLHHAICDSLRSQYSERTLTAQNMTDILSVNGMSYNMERIGDNATNIAEAAIYLVEGKNIKHWDNPNKDEVLEAGSEG